MGCLINLDKSELTPTQQFDFVGVHFGFQRGLLSPATEKMNRLMSKVSPFLSNQFVPAQAWESLLGLLNELENYVPWGKIYLRLILQNFSCYIDLKLPVNFQIFQHQCGRNPEKQFTGGMVRGISNVQSTNPHTSTESVQMPP